MTKPLPDPERKSNLLIEAGALLLAAIVATVMVLWAHATAPMPSGEMPNHQCSAVLAAGFTNLNQIR